MSVLSYFRKAGQIMRPSLARLKKDERGNLSIETLMMAPLLAFLMIAMFVYYQVFRQDSLLAKSTYTVTDILSREADPVNQDYINNMQRLLVSVSNVQSTIGMRVALVKYDELTDAMTMRWSAIPDGGTMPTFDQPMIDGLRDRIPDMSDQDSVIILETSMPYVPPFLGGSYWMGQVPTLNYRNLIIMRSRFVAELCWKGDTTCTPPNDDDM